MAVRNTIYLTTWQKGSILGVIIIHPLALLFLVYSIVVHKMEYVKGTQFYFKLFYWLGVSPYYPVRNGSKQQPLIGCRKMSIKMPGFLLVLVDLASCIALTSIFQFGLLNGIANVTRADNLMTVIFIISQFARIIVGQLQCLLYGQTYGKLVDTYSRLDVFFAQQLNHRIDFQHFTSGVSRKVYLTIAAYVQNALVQAIVMWTYGRWNILALPIKILQIFAMSAAVHFVFSVDTLTFFMEQLVAVIVRDTANDRSIDDLVYSKYSAKCVLLRNQLKNYKRIQFALWENAQRLNRFFGWSMVLFLLVTFLESSHTAYWLFTDVRHIDRAGFKVFSK